MVALNLDKVGGILSMDRDQREAVAKFSRNLDVNITTLDDYLELLRLTPEKAANAQNAIRILKSKLEQIESARSEKDLKKVIRIGKLYDRYNL